MIQSSYFIRRLHKITKLLLIFTKTDQNSNAKTVLISQRFLCTKTVDQNEKICLLSINDALKHLLAQEVVLRQVKPAKKPWIFNILTFYAFLQIVSIVGTLSECCLKLKLTENSMVFDCLNQLKERKQLTTGIITIIVIIF